MVLNKALPNTKLEHSWVELLEITLNNDPKRGVHIKKSNPSSSVSTLYLKAPAAASCPL